MKRLIYILCCLGAALPAARAWAHGTPILVSGANSTFTVSGGTADATGYVPQMFFENDDEGDPFPAPQDLENVGLVTIWQVPGYNITGMNNSSSLSIEVLAAPVKSSTTGEHRLLWYWNPTTSSVEQATSDFNLLGTGKRFVTLEPNDTVAPPAFLMASSLTGQQNTHNHALLSYALEESESTADGAYGFFARLVTNQAGMGPSSPFLIVVNYNVDYGAMSAAAFAINAAAGEPPMLEGDFNLDGHVDTADYVVWRKTGRPASDYTKWVNNYGRSSGGGGSIATENNSVPEPTAVWLLAVLSTSTGHRRKRRSF